jgi:AraC family transcriptional regulator, transcriptional activator for feuABC-ybbA operon
MKHPETKLLIAGHIAPDPDWHTKKESHDYHELIIVVRGNMRVVIAGGMIDAIPGDVLFYPAKTFHEEQSDKKNPVETFFIAFTWNQESALPVRLTDAHGRLRILSPWLHIPSDSDSESEKKANDALFHALLAEYLRLCSQNTNSLASNVRDYIRQKIGEKISLEMLAKNAGLSKYHFLRLYRRETDRTPMKDMLHLRADHARSLVTASDFPLKLIASMSGFADEQAMSRVFSRVYGTPPGQFRKV